MGGALQIGILQTDDRVCREGEEAFNTATQLDWLMSLHMDPIQTYRPVVLNRVPQGGTEPQQDKSD